MYSAMAPENETTITEPVAAPLAGPRPRRTPRLWLLRLLLPPLDRIFNFLGPRYRLFIWLVSSVPPRVLAAIGRWRAVRAAADAYRRVPAYRAFLDEHGAGENAFRTLELPAMDKDAYIRRFTIEERCVGGRLPERFAAIDESSGSTGTPYNWVRTLRERRTSHIFISHFARYCFGGEPFMTINAFSMGAWATGINMGVALERNGIVKNTGPDLDKILNTLEFLGPHRRYLMCGYPPFLKHVIDAARERGFPLGDYSLMGLVGGEGMSEGLRDYLSPIFSPVYSGFGATDLEIGIAGETPLSVAIRRAARVEKNVRHLVFGLDSRLPMLFQYNPLNHQIAINEEGELVFTIARPNMLSPRIVYNIRDEGGVATFQEMAERLHAAGTSVQEVLGPAQRKPIRLPFVWVYGRKDSTVSVMGANIYPEDVEQALYDEPELAAQAHSFCLSLSEDENAAVRPCFSFEIQGVVSDRLQAEFEKRIPERIRALNADFRTAMEEHPESARPVVELYPLGEGPFTADATKIKQTRIIKVTR
jgi:phenylacetate-CoA ligase